MIALYVLFVGGKRGQRGGQTGAKKKQTKHETASHTRAEEELATLTQRLEGLSVTLVEGKVCLFFLYICQIIASLINVLLENLTVVFCRRKDSGKKVLILVVFTY